MKRIVEIIPLILQMAVPLFSSFILNPYLIGKGLIPREALVVTMYGIAAFLLGLVGGIMIEKTKKKNANSKGSE